MDGIIDTVSGPHSLHPLIEMLKTCGKLILVGASVTPPILPYMPLMSGKLIITNFLMLDNYFGSSLFSAWN